MIDTTTLNSLFGAKIVDPAGDKVGRVKQVYVDNDNGQPLFATVATGLFGTSESFVPLQDAQLVGENLHVGYDKAMIKDAPRIDPEGALDDSEQERLFDYYRSGDDAADNGTAGRHSAAGSDHRDSGRDDSPVGAHGNDDAMIRSEESLNVDKETVPVGRVRLRKHVAIEQNVTENVSHEEVDLEDGSDRGARA